jgi:hypothetical protein
LFLHQYTSKHLLRNNIKIKLTEEFTIIYLHLHFILIFWMGPHKLSFTWVQQITSTYLQLKFKEKQKEKCKLISSILNWIDIIGNFYFLWHGQTIIKRFWFRIPPHTGWNVLKKNWIKVSRSEKLRFQFLWNFALSVFTRIFDFWRFCLSNYGTKF